MKIVISTNDHDPPHVLVRVEDNSYRVAIPDADPLRGEPTVPNSVIRQVKDWFAQTVPSVGRTVAALVYDQWLHVRNHQAIQRVPIPEQIKEMEQRWKDPAPVGYSYKIKDVTVLSNYCLRVVFENGEIRVVDVKAMRGNSPLWAPVFENFHAVENRGFDVAWPVMFPDGPNTLEIEDQDLWGAGVLEGSANLSNVI